MVVVSGVAIAALVVLGLVVQLSGGSSAPPTLARLDSTTGRIVSHLRDNQLGCGRCGPNLWVVDGTIWERTGASGTTIAIRALATGKLTRTLAVPVGAAGLAVGFGAVWVVVPTFASHTVPPTGTVERIDGLSGRVVAKVVIHGDLQNGAITSGEDAVWVLDQDGTLTRIDPASNRISGPFATGALETNWFATGAGYEWICECGYNNDLLRYDAETRTGKRIRLRPLPPSWRNDILDTIPRTFVVGVDSHTGKLWFLGASATMIPWNPRAGRQNGPGVGLDGHPFQAVLARGNIWVAAGSVVDRISLATGKRQTITLPKGMNATGVAVDPVTDTVWVSNSSPLTATRP